MYVYKDAIMMHCHNCGASMYLSQFLKDIDPVAYKEYLMENFENGKQRKEVAYPNQTPVFKKQPIKLTGLKKVSQLSPTHPAKLYVVGRMVPNFYHSRLYFCPAFNKWTNSMIPDKLPEDRDEPRLIIPFFDKDGEMFGYQGRSFKKETNMRYITIILDEEPPKLYGLDTCDQTKTFYVTEGPFDSMLLENAMAMAGSDAPLSYFDREHAVLVYDNEPRSVQICKKIDKAIKRGYKVVIWPKNLDKKDITDMKLVNEDVIDLVESNTYSGMEAQLKFEDWKRT